MHCQAKIDHCFIPLPFGDIAGNVCQAEIASLESMCQFQVVEAEHVQHRGMEVVDGNGILSHSPADFIRRPIGLAAFGAASRHPKGKRKRMMISTRIGFASVSIFSQGCASEFGPPDDQRAFEKSPLFQVLQQCCDRLVDNPGVVTQILIEVAVLVPGLIDNIDEPNAAFDHTASEQAVASERQMGVSDVASSSRLRMLCAGDSVGLVSCRSFPVKVDQLWRGGLHAKGKFVAGDAAGNLRGHPSR